MSEASKMDVRISLPIDQDRPRQVFKKQITLQHMINWINNLEYNHKIKEILIKKVSSYPVNTYEKFIKDLNVHVNFALKTITEEGGDY